MKKIPPVTTPIATKHIITINTIAWALVNSGFGSGAGSGHGPGPGHGSVDDILYNKILLYFIIFYYNAYYFLIIYANLFSF